MRDIRFRAWDKEAKKMAEFITCHTDGPETTDLNSNIQMCEQYGEHGGGFILMQYTNLRDKNGKEIYEGDIIKHYMGDSLQDNPSEVRWNDDGGWNPWLEYEGDSYTRVSEPEVIGNIYENPELLK